MATARRASSRQCHERQWRCLFADGRDLVSAGYDATLRIWKLAGGGVTVRNLPTPLNSVAIAPDGEIVTAGADGKVYFLSPQGEALGDLQASATPIIAVAISPDGKLVAAAGIRGSVAVIERKARKLERTLVGPGLPVWSVAFFPDSRTLLSGGTDRIIRRWDAISGEPIDALVVGAPSDPLAAYAGDPGAEVFRPCVACHTLSPDEGNKAGPSLAGIFGRRIATLPGYNFSPALKKLDIVWSPETVSKLFEIGPAHYTPGTKMPEQTIGSAQDRQALVDFLVAASRLSSADQFEDSGGDVAWRLARRIVPNPRQRAALEAAGKKPVLTRKCRRRLHAVGLALRRDCRHRDVRLRRGLVLDVVQRRIAGSVAVAMPVRLNCNVDKIEIV